MREYMQGSWHGTWSCIFHLITVDIIHLERTLVKMMDSQAGLIFYYLTRRLCLQQREALTSNLP